MTTTEFIENNSLENELWKPIKGFENLYMISSFGRILSCDKYTNNNHTDVYKPARLLKWNTTSNTPSIVLSKDSKSYSKHVAKTVAEHFLPIPEKDKIVLDYKDGNKNNCSVNNLFWRIPLYKTKKYYPKIISLENEIWAPVPIEEFSNQYEVSSLGRIKSLERDIVRGDSTFHIQEKLLTPFIGRGGYAIVGLGQNSKYYIHRLVAQAFIPNPNNLPQIDHINTIKSDNTINNLRWCSSKENMSNSLTKQHISNSIKLTNKTAIDLYYNNVHIKTYNNINNIRLDGFDIQIIQNYLNGTQQILEGLQFKLRPN